MLQGPTWPKCNLTKLGCENLVSRVLSAGAISEVSQYDFDTKKMMVVPKHIKLPKSDNESKGILGLDSILNPFKVNLSPIQGIRGIGSVNSGQVRSKTRKPPLRENLKFSKTLVTSQEDKDTKSTDSEVATAKTIAKKTLVESAITLKNSSLELNSFLEGTLAELSNTIHQCLTKEYPNGWGVRRSYIPILAYIFETALASANKPKEGVDINDPEENIVVNKMTHITFLAIDPEYQDTEDLASLTEKKHQEQHKGYSLAPHFSLHTLKKRCIN